MQPFLMEKPVAHSMASKFSAVLIGRIVSRYIYNSVVATTDLVASCDCEHKQLPLVKAGTHYPYIRAVCTGRIYGPYKRAVLVPKYHCRAKNFKYDVKYDVISTVNTE